jgi:hypothetical protein
VAGTDNNQLIGAADKTTAAAMVMVAETVMATERATVTATMTMPMPMPMMVH